MKRKIVVFMMCLSLGTAMLSGCGKEDAASKADSASLVSGESHTSSESDSEEEIPVVDAELPVDECVTLGEYKGLTLDEEIVQVTDEDIENALQNVLMETVDDPEATAQIGDIVDIAFVGKLDGEEFEGGSSDSYSLELGSNTFIDGFEEGVVGMKQDETKDLQLTFPENYTEELAGKDVVFTVTVNAISRPAELTDAWVQENTEYASVEEFRASKREELEAANLASAESDLQTLALQTVVEGATVSQIPQSYITLGEESYEARYTMYASFYGMELEDFLDQYVDREQYGEDKKQSARQAAAIYLVIRAVEEKEGWTTDDVDYGNRLNNYVENSGLSREEFVEQNGEEFVELTIMMDRMVDLVLENATINKVMVDSSGNVIEQ